MPRLSEDTPNESFPMDYCFACYKAAANDDYENPVSLDVEHPPYEETDYLCERCDCNLTAEDN